MISGSNSQFLDETSCSVYVSKIVFQDLRLFDSKAPMDH